MPGNPARNGDKNRYDGTPETDHGADPDTCGHIAGNPGYGPRRAGSCTRPRTVRHRSRRTDSAIVRVHRVETTTMTAAERKEAIGALAALLAEYDRDHPHDLTDN